MAEEFNLKTEDANIDIADSSVLRDLSSFLRELFHPYMLMMWMYLIYGYHGANYWIFFFAMVILYLVVPILMQLSLGAASRGYTFVNRKVPTLIAAASLIGNLFILRLLPTTTSHTKLLFYFLLSFSFAAGAVYLFVFIFNLFFKNDKISIYGVTLGGLLSILYFTSPLYTRCRYMCKDLGTMPLAYLVPVLGLLFIIALIVLYYYLVVFKAKRWRMLVGLVVGGSLIPISYYVLTKYYAHYPFL